MQHGKGWAMGRKACIAVVLLALAGGVGYRLYVTRAKRSDPMPVALDFSKRVPVALNRGPEVLDGFQGEVHPLLHGQGKLDVSATWNYDPNQYESRSFINPAPPRIRDLFLTLNVAAPSKTYTARDLSRFLPAKEPGAVGEMWALDTDKISEILKQFHPAPSMRLVAKGRRPGPDGAFGVVRAVSPSHLDLLFRIHAEFDVVPDHDKWKSLVCEAWYSPGCLVGRLIIDRKKGTVEYFRLGLPTGNMYNVHITAAYEDQEAHGWMRVNRMELVGGSLVNFDASHWVDQIDMADAHDRLTKVFYQFKNIDWIAFDKVQDAARERKKPILVIVALGTLDDQTC